jgi:hypothetical protein
MLPNILDGPVPLDMSHEGGEFEGLTEEYQKRYDYVVSFSVIIF